MCGDSSASMTGYKDGSFAYHYYSYGEFVHAFRQFFRGGPQRFGNRKTTLKLGYSKIRRKSKFSLFPPKFNTII